MAAIKFCVGMLCLALAGSGGIDSKFLNQYNYEKNNDAHALGAATAAQYSKVIEAARKEIGVAEVTENSAPRIGQYAVYVGFKTPVPWCAAWVSFCFGEAGFARPRTAWSPALFPVNRLARDALPGRVFGIYFKSLGRIGHCGIIERVSGQFVYTIEGNTNVAGSREGDRVMRRVRHKRTICKYSDWVN
jgi:hypothetical protein